MSASAPQPKNYGQVQAIHAEAKRRGLDEDALRDLVESATRRTRSIAALTHAEANKVIQHLKGNSFVPLRTLQYRRKKAGIQQIVTDEQQTLIAELASQREWSPETLQKFCKRQCKRERPLTTADANKVIEALKAMNRRDGLWAA
jgi:hypothetical protein